LGVGDVPGPPKKIWLKRALGKRIVTNGTPGTGDGLQFKRVSEDVFLDFSRRFGTSEEIGRIGTYFDGDTVEIIEGEPQLFGLFGCGKLCAIVCCTLTKNPMDDGHACKLDSVIVDEKLRRRGLAGMLVCQAFAELMTETPYEITMIHSHAVHPATVQLLSRLAFSKPAPVGAPLSSIHIDDSNRALFVKGCQQKVNAGVNKLKLHCAFCKSKDKRARPWCQPGQTR